MVKSVKTLHLPLYAPYHTCLFSGKSWIYISQTNRDQSLWISLFFSDYVIAFFVLGFLMQEFFEARRQGYYVYMSKWWNIVDTIIISTFLVGYAIWIISWGSSGKWHPREQVFVIADVLYASATVVAFFHLTHIFQVS